MRTLIAAVLIALLSPSAQAACWRIDNLRGYSAKAFESYAISSDSLRGQTFRLTIGTNSASLTPNNGLSCTRVSTTSAVCVATDGVKSIVEVWSLDPGLRKAYQVHSRGGSGQLNGATLFVGDVIASCD